MFKELAALTHLMKNAGDIQRQMGEMKDRLARMTVDGRSACGQVIVTVTGKMEVQAVRFASDPHQIGSQHAVETLVQEAVNNGLRQAKDLATREMKSVANTLGLPPEMLAKFGVS